MYFEWQKIIYDTEELKAIYSIDDKHTSYHICNDLCYVVTEQRRLKIRNLRLKKSIMDEPLPYNFSSIIKGSFLVCKDTSYIYFIDAVNKKYNLVYEKLSAIFAIGDERILIKSEGIFYILNNEGKTIPIDMIENGVNFRFIDGKLFGENGTNVEVFDAFTGEKITIIPGLVFIDYCFNDIYVTWNVDEREYTLYNLYTHEIITSFNMSAELFWEGDAFYNFNPGVPRTLKKTIIEELTPPLIK